MLRLPEDIQLHLFLYLDYKSLLLLLCVNTQFKALIDRDEVWSITTSQHFFKSNNGVVGSQIKQKMHDLVLMNNNKSKLIKKINKIEQKMVDDSRWVDSKIIDNSSADIHPMMITFIPNSYIDPCSVFSILISTRWREYKKNKYQKSIVKCQNIINDIHKSIELKKI